MGYVGLPLSVEVARAGHQAVGVDVNKRIVEMLNAGVSHIPEVPSEDVAQFVKAGLLTATTDAAKLAGCDVVVICVPTPLNKLKDPDLSYVVMASDSVRASLRRGQLVVLESTTYPGTTRDVVLPILAETGLTVGEDFFLCFSPERVDPGNPVWNTRNTPKLVGGLTAACAEIGAAFYGTVVEKVVPVRSPEVAELAKVYENTFRMVNIALANELAQVCARLRPERLGRDRGGGDETVRVHEVHAGTGLGRALHPARSPLPVVEDGESRLQDAVDRAGERDQRADAATSSFSWWPTP